MKDLECLGNELPFLPGTLVTQRWQGPEGPSLPFPSLLAQLRPFRERLMCCSITSGGPLSPGMQTFYSCVNKLPRLPCLPRAPDIKVTFLPPHKISN